MLTGRLSGTSSDSNNTIMNLGMAYLGSSTDPNRHESTGQKKKVTVKMILTEY